VLGGKVAFELAGEMPNQRHAEFKRCACSEPGLSAKDAELREFPAIFRGKPQGFSAAETAWRREVNSNCWYAFCNGCPRVTLVRARAWKRMRAMRYACSSTVEGRHMSHLLRMSCSGESEAVEAVISTAEEWSIRQIVRRSLASSTRRPKHGSPSFPKPPGAVLTLAVCEIH
jgi:hypothetical protein